MQAGSAEAIQSRLLWELEHSVMRARGWQHGGRGSTSDEPIGRAQDSCQSVVSWASGRRRWERAALRLVDRRRVFAARSQLASAACSRAQGPRPQGASRLAGWRRRPVYVQLRVLLLWRESVRADKTQTRQEAADGGSMAASGRHGHGQATGRERTRADEAAGWSAATGDDGLATGGRRAVRLGSEGSIAAQL